MNDHSVIKRKKLKKEKYVEKLQFQIIGARQYIIRSVMILCDKRVAELKLCEDDVITMSTKTDTDISSLRCKRLLKAYSLHKQIKTYFHDNDSLKGYNILSMIMTHGKATTF